MTKIRSRDEEESNDPLFVTALARGFAILRCCGESPRDLTVSEIAHKLGIAQSTAWRSCYTMLKLGYLVRVGDERLRPGLHLLTLGHAALSRQPMAELARPAMEEMAKRFPGAVSLGMRDGFQILYLLRIEGGPVMYQGLRAGSRVTLLSSAMGWAYLAALPSPERKQFLSAEKQRSPELFGRMRRKLENAFREFETKGFIVNSGVVHPEISAIAIPIAKPGEPPQASLSFGGLTSSFSVTRLEREVAPPLKALARMLSISQR